MTRTTSRTVRATIGATLATALLAVSPTTALAAAPTMFTDEFSVTLEMDDFLGCGVPVVLQESGTADYTEFVDGDGVVDRVHLRVRSTITVTSEFGELSGRLNHADVIDLDAGTFVHHGVELGSGDQGRIEIAAGRDVVALGSGAPVSFSGVNTFADGDDAAACAILNP